MSKEVVKLKEALNSLSQLSYSTSSSKRQSQQLEGLQQQVKQLQNQLTVSVLLFSASRVAYQLSWPWPEMRSESRLAWATREGRLKPALEREHQSFRRGNGIASSDADTGEERKKGIDEHV